MPHLTNPFGRYEARPREGSAMLRKKTYRIAGVCLADTGWDEAGRVMVPLDGTIEVVVVRMYQGPQLDLRLRPMVIDSRGNRRSLVEYFGAKDFVDGDDDVWRFEMREPVMGQVDSLLLMHANLDPVNDYDYSVDFSVDHAGGVWPIWSLAGHGGYE